MTADTTRRPIAAQWRMRGSHRKDSAQQGLPVDDPRAEKPPGEQESPPRHETSRRLRRRRLLWRWAFVLIYALLALAAVVSIVSQLPTRYVPSTGPRASVDDTSSASRDPPGPPTGSARGETVGG
jgi:hypothetical protein